MNDKNLLKEKILSGKKAAGALISIKSPAVMEILGAVGLDFVMIDTEHGAWEAETTEELIRACELSGLTPLARVRQIERSAVMKMLDCGAKGIVVPNVKTVEEVKTLVQWAKYAPLGERGCGLARKNLYGLDPGFSEDKEAYFRRANMETLLLPQCETVESLECIESIAAIDGVDGIFFGPFDLSIALGIPAQFYHPVFRNAIERVVRACKTNGKLCITIAGFTPEMANERYEMGFDALISEDTNFLITGARQFLSGLKGI